MKTEKNLRLKDIFSFFNHKTSKEGLNNAEIREIQEDIDKQKYVIDASICGIDGIGNHLMVLMENSIIVLTSITIRELEQMQKFADRFGRDAKFFLAIAAENPESTECVLIDENFEIADDAIINYCYQHKTDVILFTADKTMALKARSLGVKVEFFKHNPNVSSNTRTLYAAKKDGQKLMLRDLQNASRSITVISQGREYTQGWVELNVGDDVYICSKKDYGSIYFTHFRVISLEPHDNVTQIFHKRLSYNENLSGLSPTYKSIIRNFKRRFDF